MLLAQIPQSIAVPPGPFNYPAHQVLASPDNPCNFAGTYSFIQFIGNSNDIDLPQIFLCANDSFQLRFNGDAILSGDPQAGTPPGVAFAYYACQPTIAGDNLQAIGTLPGPGDPCVLQVPPPTNGLYITPGVDAIGDTWFFNNGGNIATFGFGQPVSIFFAPITLDEIIPPAGFESNMVGAPPGPCVNVNINEAFEVVYLNPITQQGVSTNFGDDCIGKFNIRGGYPEYDGTAKFTINIALSTDPSVKAVIHTQQSQMFHNAPIIFSVSQSGNYTITVEDGKSCPATFTMDMNACDPTENIVLAFPDTIAPPNSTNFCMPLTVENFDIVSGQFSINWDPNVLQYTGISALNPILDSIVFSTLNTSNTAGGELGLVIYDTDPVGNVLSVPDNESIFEVCFNVIGALGECSGLIISNSPTGVGFEDGMGQTVALTSDTGSVCIGYLPLDLQIAIIDTSCLGTASMVVTATGGNTNFDYSVVVHEFSPMPGPTYSGTISSSGGSDTIFNTIGNFNNLVNMYSVCVTDSSGFGVTVCDTISVYIPTIGAQIAFIQEPTCNGDSDGIIDGVVLFGGVPVANPGANYSFFWSTTSPPITDPTLKYQDGTVNNDIDAASYTLIVTDNNSMCSASASGSLGQPTPISEQAITLTQASCSGVANGSIDYLVEGGTPFAGNQYQFVWEDANNNPVGVPGQNNPIIVNSLTSGTYSVTITDANGCTFTDDVDITDQRAVAVNQGVIQGVSCFGLSDGGGTITVSESSPSGHMYNFTWTPGGFTQVNTSLSSAYSGLPAGSYFVTAIDPVDGCQDTLTMVVTEPALLVLDTLGIQGPGCGAQNGGSINVVAIGGSGGPNYTYTWDIPATGPSQMNLAVGTYNVTVTDIRGCQDSLIFILPAPPPVGLTITAIPEKCGNDGVLIAVAPTATLYNWTAVPSSGTLSSIDSLTGLDGGTYAVTVTEPSGCTAEATITIQDVIPLSFADTSYVEPLCFGDNNGILGVLVQDGKPPYTNYDWSPGPQVNGPTIFSISAGVYDLTVTDNVGCTLTGSFTLNQPPQVINTLSGLSDVSCFGTCDGAVEVMTSYATVPPTSGNFIYFWNDGNSIDSLRTNLCVGMYIVTSSDNNGCGATDTLFIGSPPEVLGTTSTMPTSCFGIGDGTATVMGSGGNGSPFTYLWSDPNSSTTTTVNNLTAGEYVVTVTDVNGCTGVIDSVFVTEPAEIVVNQDLINTTPPHCFGDNDGTLAVIVSGGNTGSLIYEWSDDMGVIGNSPMEIGNLSAGFYSVVVTDAEGCTGSLEDMQLQDPPPVLGSYQNPEALVCNGDVTTLQIDAISGGSGGPYQFSLDYGALLDINFPVTLSGGEHYITYFDFKGCFYEDTINVPEPAPIEVTFDPQVVEIELGDSTYQLKPLITGAAVSDFTWTPGETLHWPDSLNPFVYSFETQLYTLVVFDDKGCSGTGSVLVNVDPNRNVYVPNVFTPGVGNLNDHFNVYVGRGIEVVNYMRVYDRWGDLVYLREKFLPDNDNVGADGWDGKHRGDFVNPGVFVYIIEVKFLDGRVLLYRGDVTVLR